MLFADDLVPCDESPDRMEERLENWRGCLEDAGLKVSRAKTTSSTFGQHHYDQNEEV